MWRLLTALAFGRGRARDDGRAGGPSSPHHAGSDAGTGAMAGGSGRAWRCRSVGRTDVGLVRGRNEDSFVDRPAAALWAVADGMGGHSGGERASGLIRETLERLDASPADGAAGDAAADAYLAAVRARLHEVHAQLRAESAGRGGGVSGSAVVVLVAAGDRFACTWAGDSRLYRWRDGRLERLTRDHSLVEELVASGAIRPEAAHRHPLANRITRAVGVGDRLELDVTGGDLAPGERYLLSTDGLHGVLTDSAMVGFLSLPDLTAAADGLMAAVMRAGAPDNVTVVLVDVEPAPRDDGGDGDDDTPRRTLFTARSVVGKLRRRKGRGDA